MQYNPLNEKLCLQWRVHYRDGIPKKIDTSQDLS